ncbi:MAG: VanZ family protein [Elusimicrobia bacterium]|nr:VanZ family protein [Elusimicrobiota bacterium]
MKLTDRINRHIKISVPTAVWSIFLVTSAFYMRQVLNFLFASIGEPGVGIFLVILFTAAGFYIARLVYARRLRAANIAAICLVLAAGYIYAWNMRILEEKVHLIKYGILGWLAVEDMLKSGFRIKSGILTALAWCLAVVCVDEGIQWFLPWRVGDPRDVLFALIGGGWGILLFISALRGFRYVNEKP